MTCRGSKCCWRCKRGLGKRNVMLFTANRSTECHSLFCKCVLVQCLTFTGDLIMCKSIYIRNYKEEIRNCKLYKMNTNCITTYLSQWGQHITICVFWQFWNAVCFFFYFKLWIQTKTHNRWSEEMDSELFVFPHDVNEGQHFLPQSSCCLHNPNVTPACWQAAAYAS